MSEVVQLIQVERPQRTKPIEYGRTYDVCFGRIEAFTMSFTMILRIPNDLDDQ